MKKLLYVLLIFPLVCAAQDAATFRRDKEFYIRGNTAVIGNNLLSKDSKKSYNDTEKLNDEFKMRYVDIDDSSTTYNSSSAFLNLKESSQVIYAGLYWSAIYKGDRALKRVKGDQIYHKVIDERSKDLQQVKFMGPDAVYHDVRGSLIYDGEQSKNTSISSRAPYACMADVTALVKSQKSGLFTVANVAATEGEVLGGSAAGWLLYVVYEDDTQPLQYITTYHGFEFVNKEPVEISFGNFSTSASGEVETAITIGALEGDSNLGRDQVGIYNPEDNLYVSLDNKVRASSNFFNSSITINDSLYTNRQPNSLNTLGFDIAKIKIPNTQNAIIANNATGVKMEYKTRSDRFFVFFTAFQTTISEQNYEEHTKVSSALAKVATPQNPAETPKPIVIHQKVEIAKPKAIRDTVSKNKTYKPAEVLDPALDRLLNKTSVKIADVGSGYYVINNVFSQIDNAEKWIATLKAEGLEPQMFFRPEKKLFYVFLAASTNAVQMNNKLNLFKERELLKNSWILKVNLD